MPAAANPQSGALTDTWGRANNRRLLDRPCESCGLVFRPARGTARFCSRKCMWSRNGGQNKKLESWWVNTRGYVEGRIWVEGVRRRVKAHRYVMELMIGRPLLPSEDVHHIDGDKRNNQPSNLRLLTHGEHARLSNAHKTYRCGYKLTLSAEERANRAARMRSIRMFRHAIQKAEGQ